MISSDSELVAQQVEKGWCQFDYAINASGDTVEAVSLEAVAWCLDGAVTRALGEDASNGWKNRARLKLMVTEVGFPGLVDYNDCPGRTRAEVVAFARSVP